MHISVIVPHKGQEEYLLRCVKALSHQRYPPNKWELIIVHNDSRPLTIPISCGDVETRVAWQPKPGPAAARNMGVELARGEIIALTDADTIPDEQWLTAGANYLAANPQVAIGAGEIARPVDLRTASAIALFDAVTYLQQRTYVERHSACVTANMFIRKEVADSVGGFDEAFSDNSYDDWDWVVRAVSSGFSIEFIQDAIVLHDCIDSLRGLRTKVRRMCRGQIAFDKKHNRWRDGHFRFAPAFWGITADRLKKLRTDKRLTTYQRIKLLLPALASSYWYASEMGRILKGDKVVKSRQ